MKNLLPVLLTASISTRGMKNASFTDTEREKMYFDTLLFYINNLIIKNDYLIGTKIIFAENSGWNLQKFKEKFINLKLDNVEFISIKPEIFDISKGKGYNELLLINKTIEASKFIKAAGGFFKATGRYPIYNLSYFINQANHMIYNKNKDLYIDIKDHKLYDYLNLGWQGHSADVRIFAVKNDFYLQFIGCRHNELNDYNGHLLEGLMYDVAKSIKGKGNEFLRFKKEAKFGGLEGSNVNALSFSKNQNSIKSKMKRLVGNFIRTFFPWFWF